VDLIKNKLLLLPLMSTWHHLFSISGNIQRSGWGHSAAGKL